MYKRSFKILGKSGKKWTALMDEEGRDIETATLEFASYLARLVVETKQVEDAMLVGVEETVTRDWITGEAEVHRSYELVSPLMLV